MSEIFGGLTPSAHRSYVLSQNGLANVLKGSNNCSSWINDSYMHTFFLLKLTADMRDFRNGQTATNFVFKIYNGQR